VVRQKLVRCHLWNRRKLFHQRRGPFASAGRARPIQFNVKAIGNLPA
jgi:hypothetical protein